MTAPTTTFEGFSVTHAQILDGSQTFQEAALATSVSDDLDIYGVAESSISPNADKFTNEGDDGELSIWNWVNDADLSIRSGYLSMPLIAKLTGQNISSSGSGSSVIFWQDLWHEDSFNIAPRPMIVVMPSRDKNGVPRRLVLGLYHVDFKPVMFTGPVYRDGLKTNYDGTALPSRLDEKGVAFADGKKRFGRVISIATV
jgi:hypothetical protein